MRKNIIISLLLALSFLCFPIISMASPVDTAIQQQSLTNSKEKLDVEKAITNGNINPKDFLFRRKNDLGREELKNITSPENLSYGKPYKVVSANKELIENLMYNKPISMTLKNARYHWEIPVIYRNGGSAIPVASFSIDYINGRWEVVEIGGHLSPELSHFSSNQKDLVDYFKQNKIYNADLFIHFRIPSLGSDFLYILADNNEYFVPLIYRPGGNVFGLKNKTLYTRDQFVTTLKPFLETTLEYDESGLAGGAPIGKKSTTPTSTTPFYYKYSLILIPIAIIGIIAIKKSVSHSNRG